MNESHAHGILDEAKGKLKQAFGEATNDEKTANSGALDQVKGHVEQTWGNVKDAASDLSHSNRATEARVEAENTGHTLRDSITTGAENLKNSIARGLDNLKHDANS
jgi:uncharacterized protein YjbJ (UPF0337 family)